jgi:hypothetical protein
VSRMPACCCARIEASGGIALPELQRIAALHLHERHGSFGHSSGSRSNLFDAAHRLASKADIAESCAGHGAQDVDACCLLRSRGRRRDDRRRAGARRRHRARGGGVPDRSQSHPPEGSHWFYRIDRPTDPRCWYLRPWTTGASPAPAAETQRATARSPAGQTVQRNKPSLSESAPAAEAQRATVRSTAEQTAQRARPPLSESDQAALFLEFLRWKEQQKTAQ